MCGLLLGPQKASPIHPMSCLWSSCLGPHAKVAAEGESETEHCADLFTVTGVPLHSGERPAMYVI